VRKLFFKENFHTHTWRLYFENASGEYKRILVACDYTWHTFYFENFSCYTIDWTIYLSNLSPFLSRFLPISPIIKSKNKQKKKKVLNETQQGIYSFCVLSWIQIDFYTHKTAYNKTEKQTNKSLFHAIEMK
jgi:hypothetical protein